MVQTSYDDEGRVSERRYLDAQGNPEAPASVGVYGEKRGYDEAGNPAYIQYLNGEGRPMNGPEGWARVEYLCDEVGNHLLETWFDAEDMPCANADGCIECGSQTRPHSLAHTEHSAELNTEHSANARPHLSPHRAGPLFAP